MTKALNRIYPKILLVLCISVISFQVSAANINFKNTPITTIIEAISRITNKNFIIDPRVKGRATLIAPSALSNDELYDVLLAILAVHGYTAVEGDIATKIIPSSIAKDSLRPIRSPRNEDWILEIVHLTYIKAARMVSILRPLVAKAGHLVALSESNQLMIIDRKNNIARIKNIIEKIDIPTHSSYEIISLYHSQADEMVKLVRQLIGKTDLQNIFLVSDKRTNRIVVSGPESLRVKVRLLVADLDTLVSTKDSQIKVLYLKYSKQENIVPILNALIKSDSLVEALAKQSDDNSNGTTKQPQTKNNAKKQTVTSKNNNNASNTLQSAKSIKNSISVVGDKSVNAIILSAPEAILNALVDVIDRLDIRKPQVLIEGIIAELSISQANQLGINWGYGGASGVGIINFDNTIPQLAAAAVVGDTVTQASALNNAFSSTGITLGAGGTGSNSWLALVKAITTDSENSILSMPSIMTLDNEEATIQAGEEVPFLDSQRLDSSGNPFQNVKREDVGITLTVTPQINAGGSIAMSIEQEISGVQESSQISGAVDIITSQRRIKTNVVVTDGNAIVLGGLITDRKTNSQQKVPGLGDIPFLGQLFKSNSNNYDKSTLMVFIRPKIILDDKTSSFLTESKYSHIRSEQLDYYRSRRESIIDDAQTGLILKDIDDWQKKNEIPVGQLSENEASSMENKKAVTEDANQSDAQ